MLLCRYVASVNQAFGKVINWLHSNYLVLNLSKTRIMLVGTHQRLTTIANFNVSAYSTNLERVENFKYLGVFLDHTL